jgi:hypothetical protein
LAAKTLILSRNPGAFDTKFRIIRAHQAAAAHQAASNSSLLQHPDSPPSPSQQQPAVQQPPLPQVPIVNSSLPPPADTLDTAAKESEEARLAMVSEEIDGKIVYHRLGCKCRRSACMKKVRVFLLQVFICTKFSHLLYPIVL